MLVSKKEVVIKALKKQKNKNCDKAAKLLSQWAGDYILVEDDEEKTIMYELVMGNNRITLVGYDNV